MLRAVLDSLRKLDPRHQFRNPVMFVVEIGAVITTVGWLIQVFGGPPLGGGDEPAWFAFSIGVWLWLTVVFANFAEALAEGRGKAQADALRSMRTETVARLRDGGEKPASELRRGDVVVVEAGETIPGDGTVIEGIASVDESAITGESAPVVRESGGDRSAVTGGTRVLSDRIVVEITQEPGQSFLDKMIALVEGAERRKTPNEIALNILLAGLTLVFLAVVVSLRPFAEFSRHRRLGRHPDRAARGADPDHDRRPALGDRDRRHGPPRPPQRPRPLRPRRSRPPATSTCCCSTRPGRSPSATARRRSSSRCRGSRRPSWPKPRSSPRSPTRRPEGRSIVVLAKEYGIRERQLEAHEAHFVPFSAETRMSGVDVNGNQYRKGAGDAIIALRRRAGRAAAGRAAGAARPDRPRGRHAAGASAATTTCSASST